MLVLLTLGGGGGGVVQNRESPDFRSPEVGRYALMLMKKENPRTTTNHDLHLFYRLALKTRTSSWNFLFNFSPNK